MQVVLATWNAHKVREVNKILADSPLQLVSLADLEPIPEAPETGDTFVDNALQKAHFVAARTSGVVVADDSGLEVDALDGAPGVHSKRFTPQATTSANNAHLLDRMRGESNRTARFRCVIAVVHGSEERTADGTCEGTILTAARGDGGFGYDPLFSPEGWRGRSLGEATDEEKNAISHRGRAFRQLPRLLRELGLLHD